MNQAMKAVKWVGDSREQLRRFPKPAREAIGEALNIAQIGGKHRNAKPLIGVGSGVFEIVARYDTNLINTIEIVGDDEHLRSSLVTIRTPTVQFILLRLARTFMSFMLFRRNLLVVSEHLKEKLT